jgi:hypothetical protein
MTNDANYPNTYWAVKAVVSVNEYGARTEEHLYEADSAEDAIAQYRAKMTAIVPGLWERRMDDGMRVGAVPVSVYDATALPDGRHQVPVDYDYIRVKDTGDADRDLEKTPLKEHETRSDWCVVSVNVPSMATQIFGMPDEKMIDIATMEHIRAIVQPDDPIARTPDPDA